VFLPGLTKLLTVAGPVPVSAVPEPALNLSTSQAALVNQTGDLILEGLMQKNMRNYVPK